MKIYTKTGDEGRTSVIGGRVEKDDARVEAYGTVDELNSFLGQAITLLQGEMYDDLREDLQQIQHELFDCGSDLAILGKAVQGGGPDDARTAPKTELPYQVVSGMVDNLESWIDKYDAETPDITRFILPGGSSAAAALHICRTVCRRAERRVVTLAREQDINPEVRRYLNRLSDLFFTVTRTANFREGQNDVEYMRGAEVFRSKPVKTDGTNDHDAR
jgi:cob(I)alamin adenosyltransferase